MTTLAHIGGLRNLGRAWSWMTNRETNRTEFAYDSPGDEVAIHILRCLGVI